MVVCKQDPKVTFWDKVSAHLPGGKKKVKPTKMTCDEFVDLDDTVKPEAVYWAAGYNAGVKEQAVGEVDLERDVGVVVIDCKQAPKESFWTKVKKHFHRAGDSSFTTKAPRTPESGPRQRIGRFLFLVSWCLG